MNILREWMTRFRATLRPRRSDADLEDELRTHLELATERQDHLGGSTDHSRRAAVLRAGGVAQAMETVRDQRGLGWLRDLARDWTYGWRSLRRHPTFTATAVVTLALAIGANAAIFSLADAVIFRELPVHEPQELARAEIASPRGNTSGIFSYPRYIEIRDRARAFSVMASAGSFAIPEPIAIEQPDVPRRETRVRLTVVSGNYFETLGLAPAIGRLFTGQDDLVPGNHPVTVASHRFWQRELGATRPPIDARVVHNGVAYQVIGVTPPSFTGISSNDDPDLWMPMMMTNAILNREMIRAPNTSSLYVFGRLRPGVTLAAAAGDMARVHGELEPADAAAGLRGDVVPMARGVQTLRAQFEQPLVVLLAVAGLLVVMAAVNLAALSMARTAARRHEMAVRLSLGASRLRVWRQCFVESVLIGLLGGAAGVAVAAWGTTSLIGLVTTSTRRLPLQFTADGRLLAFAAVASVASVVLFGFVPALHASRTHMVQAFTTARVRAGLPGSRPMIAIQMALSMFLLVGAGLFARSLLNLRTLDTGFAPGEVLVLMLDARAAYGEDIGKYLTLSRDLVPQIEALPGVRSASLSSATFFGSSISRGNVTYEGQPGEAPREEWPIKVAATPHFADTLGLSLVAGRMFTDRDDRRAPRVAVISESIAKRYFPEDGAVGRRLAFDSSFRGDNAIEIVGVVRDVHYNSLRSASPYTLYLPLAQAPSQRVDLQVRGSADPRALAPQVQEAVRRYDPAIRIVHAVTLDQLVTDSIAQDRLLALLGGSAAAMALVLSAVGIFGVTAYSVERRTPEIGLRMALGASTVRVRWLILRDVILLASLGGAAGLAAALAASDAVRGLLFRLAPTDPMTLAGAAAILIAIALVSAVLPARRACRLDPWCALQRE